MDAKSNRNALDFLKFIFVVLIVLFHSRMMTSYQENMIVINGGAGVEFFFIVSGCLMCASATRRAEQSRAEQSRAEQSRAEQSRAEQSRAEQSRAEHIGLDTYCFMKKKVARLMPNFIIAFGLAFAVFHYNAGINDWSKLGIDIIKSLPDLLMIKNSGIRLPSYNGPTWYISSMLLNMLVLYPLIRKFKDSFYIIALAIMLFILGGFWQTYGTYSNLEDWNGWILKGTIRGTAGLCAGCLCYKAGMALGKNKWTAFGKTILMTIEWACYIATIILCCKYPSGRIDYLIFFLFMIGVTITWSNTSFDEILFRPRIFSWLGSFSFSLYLSHSPWREFISNIYPQEWGFKQCLIVYLVVSVWSGLLVHELSVFFRALKVKYGGKIKALFIVPN